MNKYEDYEYSRRGLLKGVISATIIMAPIYLAVFWLLVNR